MSFHRLRLGKQFGLSVAIPVASEVVSKHLLILDAA